MAKGLRDPPIAAEEHTPAARATAYQEPSRGQPGLDGRSDRFSGVRFGLDVAQHRMPWDEIVRRVRLAEALGFDGVWGFDHFQPMYGEGPGETFEGMTTLAALAGMTSRVRLGLLVTG